MKNKKQTKIILYPQDLTPPKNYLLDDTQELKALKANCLFYWRKHRFPDCCDFHRQRILDRQLDLEAWSNSGEHLFEAITYTVFFVKKAMKDSEGLARSKTYIDSILFSFGTHSPIRDKYIEWTVAILKKQEFRNGIILQNVIDYLETPEERAFEQLAAAEQAFHKWLGSLPEDLFPEEVRQNLVLIFFRGIIKSLEEVNGVRSLTLYGVDQFLEYLSDTTGPILHEIWQSIARGDIHKTIQEASIINRNKTITKINLNFQNYSDSEKNYFTIIQQWGNLVSDFIDREIELKQKTAVPVNATKKLTQKCEVSFPELFRHAAYYDVFIETLIRSKLIDENLVWIDRDKNKMITIFWGLLNVKKSGHSIFSSGPPKPTPYGKKVFAHFKIDTADLCSARYLMEPKKHTKVTVSMKNKCTKELEETMFQEEH